MKYFLPIIFLASCAQKPDVTVRSRLYQPPVLILAPNTTIQTIDGEYLSGQTKELWYPSRKVEELEKQLSQF
ncbi:MAG: hypothetical protein FMNOHCHN_03142 [Ignavibacteriaceae bacterium]|nr:hypothetical protein [Ignavibacteriaceae bacterium]